MDATTKTLKSTTRVDNSTNPNFKHTSTFHTRGQWTPESPPPLTSTYTIFHGERPELPRYVPKYAVSPETAALTSRHGSSPYSFRATAERAGSTPDGRATYRFSGLPGWFGLQTPLLNSPPPQSASNHTDIEYLWMQRVCRPIPPGPSCPAQPWAPRAYRRCNTR